MARVLVLLHQQYIGDINEALCAFYETFLKKLEQQGNNVKCINMCYVKPYWSETNKFLSKKEECILIEKVKTFNPELIITFNNQITFEIIENTECPICLFDADSFELFPNKDFIKKYYERYHIFSFWENLEEEKYINFGIEKSKITYLHLATAIKNENIEKTTNISFIGTKFAKISKKLKTELITNKDILNDINNYYKNPYENYENFIKKYSAYSESELYSLLDPRCQVLESLCDLGLKIYGVEWDKLPRELFNLELCFDKTPKYSLKHNQDIYNSSKINLSVSHPQSKGYGFPWRVFDIMASNGLLISSYSKLLEDKTKDFVKIPMFKSPYEARDLCKYALENPNYCFDIISASNEYIKQNGQWNDNFKIIENAMNIKLLNENIAETPYEIYYIEKRKPKKIPTIKLKFKNIFYGLLLIISQIPVVDLLFSEKSRIKLYNSIKKYSTIDKKYFENNED